MNSSGANTQSTQNNFPKDFDQYVNKIKTIKHPLKDCKKIDKIEKDGKKLDIYQYINKQNLSDTNHSITIIFVGQTGVGKSTLINAYVNFLLGVYHDQPCRYKIVIGNKEKEKDQTKSQTEEITIYKIQSPLYPGVTFKLIDTPGFGDTENKRAWSIIEENSVDKKYLERFENFFNNKLVEEETGIILGICFVVKAAENRITKFQKQNISSLINLFGEYVGSNFLALLTHPYDDNPEAVQVLTREIEEFRKKEERKAKWYWCISSMQYFEIINRRARKCIFDDNIYNFISFTQEIMKLPVIDLTLTKKILYLKRGLNDLKKFIINECLFCLLNNYKYMNDKDKMAQNINNIEKQTIKAVIKMKIIIDEINKIEIQSKNNKPFEKHLNDIFEDNDIFIKNSDKIEPLLHKINSILKENEEKISKEYNINKNDILKM